MFMLLLLLLFGIQNCSQFAVSQSAVKFLPGFQGPLPFELETGYVGVDESDDVQLFYYFVKSDRNPKEDPLILWLTGGKGCSSFTGLVYEIVQTRIAARCNNFFFTKLHSNNEVLRSTCTSLDSGNDKVYETKKKGPLYFEAAQYNGVLPKLALNHNSWTKVASIIFLDLPVGTGFSYGRTSRASQSNDLQLCAQAFQFIRKWLTTHSEFLSNPFYMGGDSYSGIPIPIIAQLISNGNQEGTEQFINLKGYILGNPKTFPGDGNYAIPFSHGMGIISDELFESLRRSCGYDYQKLALNNEECSRDFEAFEQCQSGINRAQILETKCPLDSPQLYKSLTDERRALNERFRELNNLKSSLSGFHCRVDGYWLSRDWLNDDSVRKALHIREGTKGTWIRCEHNLPYKTVIWDSRPYHLNLSRIGYRSLVYSGDHDMLVPFQSTQAWIRSLNYSIIDEWRPWIVKGQYAGYTRTYSNHMTFATVKGGGHTAPEYKPEECYAMFKRWISYEPL